MGTVAIFNSRGFTLMEFLVAIVILMVGLLGLLQTINYAISHNMVNQLRQEALLLADERMNHEKIKPFDSISTNATPPSANNVQQVTLQRLVNGAFRNYSVTKTNNSVTTQSKNIELQVTWRYKNQRYVHAISSLVTNVIQK